jgi:hypothetical protein
MADLRIEQQGNQWNVYNNKHKLIETFSTLEQAERHVAEWGPQVEVIHQMYRNLKTRIGELAEEHNTTKKKVMNWIIAAMVKLEEQGELEEEPEVQEAQD